MVCSGLLGNWMMKGAAQLSARQLQLLPGTSRQKAQKIKLWLKAGKSQVCAVDRQACTHCNRPLKGAFCGTFSARTIQMVERSML